MKPTHSQEIIKYVQSQPQGAWGGIIEDVMRASFGHKGDTTARRLRELVEEGKIVCEKKIPPKGKRKVNYYTIPRPPQVLPQFAREQQISMKLNNLVK